MTLTFFITHTHSSPPVNRIEWESSHAFISNPFNSHFIFTALFPLQCFDTNMHNLWFWLKATTKPREEEQKQETRNKKFAYLKWHHHYTLIFDDWHILPFSVIIRFYLMLSLEFSFMIFAWLDDEWNAFAEAQDTTGSRNMVEQTRFHIISGRFGYWFRQRLALSISLL